MVTLSNLDGSSLVAGGFAEGLGGVFESFRGADEKRALADQAKLRAIDTEDALDLLEGGTEAEQENALARLATLQGPAVANSIRQTLERGDKNELLQAERDSEKILRRSIFLGGIKDPAKRANAIREEAQRASAQGEDIGDFVELMNMTPEQQEMELGQCLVILQMARSILYSPSQ